MTRKLKALGLMFGALLAMSAVAAPVASADDFTSEAVTPILTGTNEVEKPDAFQTTAGVVQCKHAVYESINAAGAIAGVTTPTTTVTIRPTYPAAAPDGTHNCTVAGLPQTTHMNGCDFKFTITGGTSTVGDVKLECPAGNEVTVTTNVTPTGTATVRCTLHIPEQTLTGDPITYTNAAGDIIVSINAHGISYKHTTGTGLGSCTSGSAANGTYVGKALIGGETAGGANINLLLSNV
ncbi:MAG TPA: hypothetical protein VK899_09260 [Gemmatimonadales bacterium]|nr:hypothetical protein [Gemmatimonadales bacterium]